MKAILVVDMPNHCSKCPCWDRDYPVCCVLNKENNSKDYGHRPEWCPLKPMPQKLAENYSNNTPTNTYIMNGTERQYLDMFAVGYNHCISEILGEE